MSSDDEDAEISGDGSGSGEGPEVEEDVLTQLTANNATAAPPPRDQRPKVNLTMDTPQQLAIGGE